MKTELSAREDGYLGMANAFYIVYTIWLGSEIVIGRLTRLRVKDRKGLDYNTLPLIWITIVVSLTLAILFASYFYYPIIGPMGVRYAGLALIVAGVILRALVIRSLGKAFTVNVTIREGHTLKTDGIYSYLRHPSYSFSLLSFIGLGFSLNNWISMALIVIPVTAVFLRRIRVEEAALEAEFGQQYLDYKKKTYRLIPWLY